MDRAATEIAIKLLLKAISDRLCEASGIAKAAEACAHASVDKSVEILLDVEQSCYEASRLLDAVSMLNRLSAEQETVR